ncbi:MAG: cation acetate symporter [Planctomycetota bacterium]|nr:cation acetate symporter [Planctomycetota bacterium]
MIYEANPLAIAVFSALVLGVLAFSFYLGAKAKSSQGYFAAGGSIPWFVNGIAFAGDYLSAASFLGICGMIGFYGFDGFLYSIGYLAGWIVALLVIAEPLKRLGRYTFADALDSKYQSRGIKAAAGLSTLVVSLFYLIPQMVGAGVLVKPLLGLQYWHGVVLVGAVVVFIVVTAGMVSTTYVQFLKGGLLVIFSLMLTVLILYRGLNTTPENELGKTQVIEVKEGKRFVNGVPIGFGQGETNVQPVGKLAELPDGKTSTGPLNPLSFISTISQSKIEITSKVPGTDGKTSYVPKIVNGKDMLSPGNLPTFKGIRSESIIAKIDFVSLMLALFAGTASLPHILIRYYTVKDQASARKSTIVGIASIGFFYILTLYIGLGAMVSGTLDPTDSNMAAPLLAKSFSNLLFAAVSAIAFTTVLGTVSGLIIAAGGSVAHDIVSGFFGWKLTDHQTIAVAKGASIVIGVLAIALGLKFEGMNVTYLVGWAFAIAASANLPALLMLLYWKGTTRQGIIAGVLVGLVTSLLWVFVTPDMFTNIYKLDPKGAWMPLNQPGIVTIPLSFLAIFLTSMLTRNVKGST